MSQNGGQKRVTVIGRIHGKVEELNEIQQKLITDGYQDPKVVQRDGEARGVLYVELKRRDDLRLGAVAVFERPPYMIRSVPLIHAHEETYMGVDGQLMASVICRLDGSPLRPFGVRTNVQTGSKDCTFGCEVTIWRVVSGEHKAGLAFVQYMVVPQPDRRYLWLQASKTYRLGLGDFSGTFEQFKFLLKAGEAAYRKLDEIHLPANRQELCFAAPRDQVVPYEDADDVVLVDE